MIGGTPKKSLRRSIPRQAPYAGDARDGRRSSVMTILIADDDRGLVLLLSKHFIKRGFEVAGAYDAMQASVTAMRKPIDAVILDINMPAGTGYEVLKRMRSQPKSSLIPVIVLTGSIQPGEEQKVKAMGADAFLQKPVDLAQLDSVMAALLGVPVDSAQLGIPASSRSAGEKI
jgi:two-component system cell cycle response regulator